MEDTKKLEKEASKNVGRLIGIFKGKQKISTELNKDSSEETDSLKIKGLIEEVDKNVRGFIEVFTFLLKYKILFRGSGLEFAGLREYSFGEDDASRIEWKASLRSQRLYVKQYEEERNLNIFVLFDSSASMLFGTQDKLKSEYAAILAATLSFAGIEVGDNIGFAMFNEKIINFLEPSQDISQYYQILKLLVDEKNYGGVCNMEDSLSMVLNNIPEKTALFIISDFIGIGDIEDKIKMCAGKFDRVFGLMIRDPREESLPDDLGYISFLDPFSNKTLTINPDKIREKFEETVKKDEAIIERMFIESGAGFIKICIDKHFAEPIIKYLQFTEGY